MLHAYRLIDRVKLRNFILMNFITLHPKRAITVTLKNFFAILLIFCLFLPIFGTIGYLHLEKKKHRKEIRKQIFSGIKENELVVLSFSKEEILTRLNWKHDGEFEFAGHMYDIVKKDDHGGSITYHCILGASTGRSAGPSAVPWARTLLQNTRPKDWPIS